MNYIYLWLSTITNIVMIIIYCGIQFYIYTKKFTKSDILKEFEGDDLL